MPSTVITNFINRNVNDLLNHKEEIINLNQLNKTDILLISEIHFIDRTMLKTLCHAIYYGEYGGAVIIIRTISHHKVAKYQTEKI